MAQIRYFLGGNTPKGFYSLYDELSDPDRIGQLYILKGGAGCGKSTLMKELARRGEAAGLSVEYILCSGDPGSLDGVVFPALSAAVVDGTAPHVTEAAYAGAVERYVDLSRFYDRDALQPLREEIISVSGQYRRCYRDAYRCLGAAGVLAQSRREQIFTDSIGARLEKRAKGIIRRELGRPGSGSGRLTRRFLTAITHRGPTALWETVDTQAQRVFCMSDSFGLAHHLLSPIRTAALAAGYDVTDCPDPMCPERTAHLIIPELRLAFVSDNHLFPYPGKPFRHLRLDAMAESELPDSLRPRLRFSRKISAALLQEGISGLSGAKEAHDRLEALYNPHVDFDGVMALADELAGALHL